MQHFVKNLLFIFISFYGLYATEAVSSTQPTVEKIQKILPEFEKVLEDTFQKWHLPGMLVAIVTPNQVVFMKTMGVSIYGNTAPLSKDTVIQVASLTKPVTTALAGVLQEEKKIALNTKVKDIDPNFNSLSPVVQNSLTLEDLLGHRCGLKDFEGESYFKSGLPARESIRMSLRLPLSLNFREDYSYSNIMFGYFGLLLEDITGKSINDLAKENIFTPLNMNHSSYGEEFVKKNKSIWEKMKGFIGLSKNNYALPHDLDVNNTPVPISLEGSKELYVYNASSGLNTTLQDYIQFVQCLLNKGKNSKQQQVIPRDFIALMEKPQAKSPPRRIDDFHFPPANFSDLHYGLGLYSYTYLSGQKNIALNGQMAGVIGQRALLAYSKAEKFAIIVITNLGHFNVCFAPESIRNSFLDLYLNAKLSQNWNDSYYEKVQALKTKTNKSLQSDRLRNPKPPRDFKQYVGEYKNPEYGTAKIERLDNGLKLMLNGKSCSLTHFNGDKFLVAGHEFNPNLSRKDKVIVEFGYNKDNTFSLYFSYLNDGLSPIFLKID